MFLELHMLQNFAPSNLNRDDTGAPKDCEFGGYRRARVSSQCLKRAIRDSFKGSKLLGEGDRAIRTKRLVEKVAEQLTTRGRPETEARQVAEAALRGIGFGIKDEQKTEYLVFLGARELDAVVETCDRHWDALAGATAPTEGKAKDKKQAAKAVLPNEVGASLTKALDGGRAADVALFGRMLADLPERNVDAACQVAHAISTNRVSMEFDFYTAVDDLKPEDTAGADMLGTVEFNSACFYRYANVDMGQLKKNLGGDEELASKTVEAFLRAGIAAVPTGKQNSMAAQNPPSLVFAVVREAGLWSLANAFVQPIRPGRDGDLMTASIGALDSYWGKLVKMYGDPSATGKWVCTLHEEQLDQLAPAAVGSVDLLVKGVVYGGNLFGKDRSG